GNFSMAPPTPPIAEEPWPASGYLAEGRRRGMKLTDRVALVTRASRGIGRGCALELARAGADVVINYRSHPEEAEEVVTEIRGMGRRAMPFGADVGERAAV